MRREKKSVKEIGPKEIRLYCIYPTIPTLPPMFGISLSIIYLFKKNKVRQLQIEFSRILTIEKQV